MRCRNLLICLSALFLLSGCNFTGSADTLLRRPQITEEQQALDEALRDDAGLGVNLKYPQRGGHLSAFVFFSQRADDIEDSHVAVFYARTTDAGLNDLPTVAVMTRDEDGRWVPKWSHSAPDGMQDVDFITFRPMVNTDYNNIIVGWSSPRGERRVVVYQLQGDSPGENKNDLKVIFEQEYSECLDEDIDGDGLYELFLITASAQNSQVKLVRRQTQGVEVTAEEVLGPMESYRLVQYGMLSDGGLGALFIDYYTETDAGRMLDTKIVTVDVTLIDTEPLAELIPEEWGLYTSFLRPENAAVCEDIKNSGAVAIPVVSYMPGYTGEEPTGSILLTDYIGMVPGGGFEKILSAVINQRSGYMFILPDHWLYPTGTVPSEPKVTVHNNSSWDEWSFYVYQGSREMSFGGIPLLRIRVVSSQSGAGDLPEQGYVWRGDRGLFQYYTLIPEGSDITDIPIKNIDIEELSLFRTL